MHKVSKSNIDFTIEERAMAMMCIGFALQGLQYKLDAGLQDNSKATYTESQNQILLNCLKFTLTDQGYYCLFVITCLDNFEKILDIKKFFRKLMALEFEEEIEQFHPNLDFEKLLKRTLQACRGQAGLTDDICKEISEDMGWKGWKGKGEK